MEVPEQLYLCSLNYSELYLIKPIPIEVMIITTTDTQWIASCPCLNHEWGVSYVNQQTAIKFLAANIVELYYFLRKNKNNLGPGMIKIWETAQQYIEEI